MSDVILEVENLHVTFLSDKKELHPVRGVSFNVRRQETLAIVGESGSGKSVTSKSIMKLLPKQNSRISEGKVIYNGKDLVPLTNKEMQNIRGSEISMVFQDPMTALNPTMTVGAQITEVLRRHQVLSKEEANQRAIQLLELVGIANAAERMKTYPHQFSGGMRQRVVIAIALACRPKILIADEPTTALDVTIQAQILDLMKDLQEKTGTAIILITHDLGVVANVAQRVAVMYGGKIVEMGTVDEIFYQPKHPYTWGLLKSVPKLNTDNKEDLIPIPGTPPNISNLPAGCAFSDRCPYVMKVCRTYQPETIQMTETQSVACWLNDPRAPKVGPEFQGSQKNIRANNYNNQGPKITIS